MNKYESWSFNRLAKQHYWQKTLLDDFPGGGVQKWKNTTDCGEISRNLNLRSGVEWPPPPYKPNLGLSAPPPYKTCVTEKPVGVEWTLPPL